MENRIAQALTRLFEKHRIVYWYDAKSELRADFEAVSLDGVDKIEVANNEFGIKHRILRHQPEDKFLLYRDGPQPEDLDNWLLDVQLAHGAFRTDQVAIWLAGLDLGLEFADVVQRKRLEKYIYPAARAICKMLPCFTHRGERAWHRSGAVASTGRSW